MHPTIVFEVNLETVDRVSTLVPEMYQSSPDRGRTDADNQKTLRSTWIPGLNRGNHELKHGDQFTVQGMQAYYLKTTYTTGSNPILKIISET